MGFDRPAGRKAGLAASMPMPPSDGLPRAGPVMGGLLAYAVNAWTFSEANAADAVIVGRSVATVAQQRIVRRRTRVAIAVAIAAPLPPCAHSCRSGAGSMLAP